MEETHAFPKMEEIELLKNLEKISSAIPNRLLKLEGYIVIKSLFNFFFGSNFTQPIAKFLGLVSLLIYILGLIQWSIIKFPKNGRNSYFSENGKN